MIEADFESRRVASNLAIVAGHVELENLSIE
jgi:hypothetical protein